MAHFASENSLHANHLRRVFLQSISLSIHETWPHRPPISSSTARVFNGAQSNYHCPLIVGLHTF
jgi:hypothetical protein